MLVNFESKEIVAELVLNFPISATMQPTVNNNFTDDDFKYSAAQFDVDYLEGMSSTNSNFNSLSRKSLFVKFDPLISQRSPRGMVPAHGNNGDLANAIPQFEGNLLLHSTPPLSAPRVVWDNHVDVMPTPDNTTSHSSRLSPVLIAPTASCSLSSSIKQQEPNCTGPETGRLVDVLKHSEHDLPEILEASRKRNKANETAKLWFKVLGISVETGGGEDGDIHCLKFGAVAAKHQKLHGSPPSYKHEERVKALREKVAKARKHLQQSSKRKNDLQAKGVDQGSGNKESLAELNSYTAKCESHLERKKVLFSRHIEDTKKVASLEQQLELVSKDSTILENSFDELHQRYVRLKAVHQQLVEGNKILHQRMTELKSWRSEDTTSTAALQVEQESLQQRAEERFDSIRKDHSSKMIVEKAKSLKLKMNLENIEKAYKQKEEEKELASQICDELMKQLETIQTGPINV